MENWPGCGTVDMLACSRAPTSNHSLDFRCSLELPLTQLEIHSVGFPRTQHFPLVSLNFRFYSALPLIPFSLTPDLCLLTLPVLGLVLFGTLAAQCLAVSP